MLSSLLAASYTPVGSSYSVTLTLVVSLSEMESAPSEDQEKPQLESQKPPAPLDTTISASTTLQLQPELDSERQMMIPSPSCSMTASSKIKLPSNKYRIRYQWNNSARWDGKEIDVDAEWLEMLYEPSTICEVKEVELPWLGKKGRIQHWKAVHVDANSKSVRTLVVYSYTSAHAQVVTVVT